jgi:hypothetical protein
MSIAGAMHRNQRYVKSGQIRLSRPLFPAVAAALAFAAPGGAEVVAKVDTQAVLAVSRSFAPVVAYTDDGGLYVARRPRVDGWRSRRVAALPAGTTYVAGMVLDPRGRPSIVVEDLQRGRLVLVRLTTQRGWRSNVLVTTARGTLLGRAGIVLDADGRPAVAYAVRRPSGGTFLRLTRLGADGRFRTQAITLEGFPSSSTAPAAMPLRVGRTMHVVEAVGSTAIDWGPTSTTWEGQYLFASKFGTTVGAVAALMVQGTLHAALTLDLPQFEESYVFSIVSRTTQDSTLVFPHALLAGLAVPPAGPEIAANDFVTTEAGTVFGGLVATPTVSVEVDGRIDGYAAIAEGSRYLLLAHPTGLEFFAVPALLPITVRLEATAHDGSVFLNGAVTGARAGEIELYHETPSLRTLAIRVPLRSDGTFALTETAPPPGTHFRAVYREPTTGLPYASLVRTPCCASPQG